MVGLQPALPVRTINKRIPRVIKFLANEQCEVSATATKIAAPGSASLLCL
jgi:hypothetical protein